MLVPLHSLRRAKEMPDSLEDLADHVDTWIIKNLPLEDLMKIRAMWTPCQKPAASFSSLSNQQTRQPSVLDVSSSRDTHRLSGVSQLDSRVSMTSETPNLEGALVCASVYVTWLNNASPRCCRPSRQAQPGDLT
jgi:hypothetical protein